MELSQRACERLRYFNMQNCLRISRGCCEETFDSVIGRGYISQHGWFVIAQNKIKFPVVQSVLRLRGGGGDGGATGAESRDSYLQMYAQKKPEKRKDSARCLGSFANLSVFGLPPQLSRAVHTSQKIEWAFGLLLFNANPPQCVSSPEKQHPCKGGVGNPLWILEKKSLQQQRSAGTLLNSRDCAELHHNQAEASDPNVYANGTTPCQKTNKECLVLTLSTKHRALSTEHLAQRSPTGQHLAVGPANTSLPQVYTDNLPRRVLTAG
eukprot:2287805-Pyramimonas_sp.AAC.1